VLPTGELISGARAVFESLAVHPSCRALLNLYDHLPGFAPVTEAAYRFIAFLSYRVQVQALIESHGVPPVALYLSRVQELLYRPRAARPLPSLDDRLGLPERWLIGPTTTARTCRRRNSRGRRFSRRERGR